MIQNVKYHLAQRPSADGEIWELAISWVEEDPNTTIPRIHQVNLPLDVLAQLDDVTP